MILAQPVRAAWAATAGSSAWSARAAPAVEELAVLGDPGPGVHRAGQVIGLAEPRGRIAREPWRADHGHPRSQVRAQVVAEDGLVEGLTGVFGSRVRVRVDQAWQQPALAGQLGAGDRIVGPPVTVGEQVDRLAIGQGEAADPQDGHPATLTTGTAGGGGGWGNRHGHGTRGTGVPEPGRGGGRRGIEDYCLRPVYQMTPRCPPG
jgi:hypothetical protein